MSKLKFSFRFLAIAVISGIVLSSCGPSTPTPPALGGIVQGAVYGDLNGNGSIDPGEGVLEGVKVTLADCGAVQTLVTAADGLFNFIDLPAGTCHVSVEKPGWIYSGSYPSLSYPVPVASNPALPTSFSLFMAPINGAAPSATPSAPISTSVPTSIVIPTGVPTIVLTPTSSIPTVTPKSAAANCRFGPATGFLAVGGLNLGNTVPIHASIADMSWWQIENPQEPGTFCWVSSAVTNTIGDLSLVPIVPIPTALVTSVVVTTPAVVHGFCGGPNATNFTVVITTNGPITVQWHFEIYTSGNTLLNTTTDQPMVFAAAGPQTYVSDAYKRDCGSYIVKAVTTSPNVLNAQASWTVVQP